MNVKRYTVAQCCGFGEMEESPHGEFVPASDYDALAAELEAVKAQRDALAKRINHDGTPVDIAALCVEIDEVTDELARVKAESLRVVPDGEVNIWLCESLFMKYGNTIYTRAPEDMDDGGRWVSVFDNVGFTAHVVDGLYVDSTIVQTVRLERWEAEG